MSERITRNNKGCEMKNIKKLTPIVILSDGTTWTTLEGCCIKFITDRQMSKLEAGSEPDDLDKKTKKVKISNLLKLISTPKIK